MPVEWTMEELNKQIDDIFLRSDVELDGTEDLEIEAIWNLNDEPR